MKDNEIPYFSWDRAITNGDIVHQLSSFSGFERTRLVAWIMREARFPDVWKFMTPKDVSEHFTELYPLLGRRKEFWKYTMDTWHELGKI
jgi:hypothetical protein